MRCTKCNAKLREGAAFCSKCGTPVEHNIKEKDKTNMLILFLSVLATVLIIGLIICVVIKHNQNEKKQNINENEEVITDASEVINPESVTNEEDLDAAAYELFGISKDTVADYGNAEIKDSNEYAYYNSGIEKFEFGYPKTLYSKVNVQEGITGEYGTIIKQVNMSASDGSTASFSIGENDISGLEDMTIQGMTDYVFGIERQKLYAPNVIVDGVSSAGDRGTIILCGYENDAPDADCKYLLCRVEEGYIYHMMYTYPRPVDEEDDINKGYFSDVMYRLCGFGGSSSGPVSFDEYKESRIDQFALSERQEYVLKELVEYIIYHEGIRKPDNNELVNLPIDMMQNNQMLLQLFYFCGTDNPLESSVYAYMSYDIDSNSTNMYYVDEFSEEQLIEIQSSSCGEKRICPGLLEYARTFYRDLLGCELDTSRVLNDSKTFDPGDGFFLIYNSDYNELAYAFGYAGSGCIDGPTELAYDDEKQEYVFSFGPTYDISSAGESWQEHCDMGEPGNGIYRIRIKPYINNSLGFKLISVGRDK